MDTHYALIGGSVFGGFAALYYWYPKMTGRVMGEGMARVSFWLLLVGVHLTFLPMFFAALEGQVVDLSEYYEGLGLDGYNLVSSIGSFVLAAGILMTLINAVYSVRHGIRAGHDPWGGDTLEWFALSPPPPHNFDAIPDVRSTEPMRDIRDGVRRRTEGWRPPAAARAPRSGAGARERGGSATAEASSSEESPSGESGGSVA